jgi:diaminopimelate decarboxylase
MKTPVFVFQAGKLRENYNNFRKTAEKHLRKFKICYSVKTNSYPALLSELSSLNSGFEIASLEEIKLVKKLHKKPELIVFNSPAKAKKEIKLALENKILINIDSESELNKISKITKSKEIEVGLRIAIEESKFGISIDQIEKIIEKAKEKNLNITCLSFHPGTQINLNEYSRKLKIFSDIISRIQNKINLEYIDLGGGIPDKQQLKNLSLLTKDYFKIIQKYFSQFNKTIILEPGRILISDSFYLLTKVIAIKKQSRTYAILDAGINILPKITLANYKFSKYNKIAQTSANKSNKKGSYISNKEYILAGPLLFSNDVLGKFYGNLKEGQILKVENVGAYCYNLAWEISYKKPGIIID